jgi:hypothetical protein
MVELNSRVISHNEVGISQSMLRVARVGEESRIRCARRSSAALRTALSKEADAEAARIEAQPIDATKLAHVMHEDGSAGHAAKLRRDVKACAEQLDHAQACGDRPLVSVPLVGRVVRLHGKFFSICAFCGSMLQVDSMRRYAGEICCCRCDAAMLGLEAPKAQAARVVQAEPRRMQREPPLRLSSIVDAERLACRFCAKAPPISGTSRFRILRAPHDSGGRNAHLPPPLRIVAFCAAHWKPWVEGGLLTLPLGVVIAHIAERAVPCFGAEQGRKALQLAPRAVAKPRTKAHKLISKRVVRRCT